MTVSARIASRPPVMLPGIDDGRGAGALMRRCPPPIVPELLRCAAAGVDGPFPSAEGAELVTIARSRCLGRPDRRDGAGIADYRGVAGDAVGVAVDGAGVLTWQYPP